MSPTPNTFTAAKFHAALEYTSTRYHQIALIVGRTGSGKSALLRDIAQTMGIPIVNLSMELSARFLPLTTRERKLKASDITADILDCSNSPRLAVDNTEIMFDPTLMLNPLGLLQSVSRTRLLIWTWNGSIDNGHVIYAYPGHPEYHRIPTQDMTLIALD